MKNGNGKTLVSRLEAIQPKRMRAEFVLTDEEAHAAIRAFRSGASVASIAEVIGVSAPPGVYARLGTWALHVAQIPEK